MYKITFLEKINGSGEEIKIGEKLSIDFKKLIDKKTQSLYVRHDRKNYFLSQRNCGGRGNGDICNIKNNTVIHINKKLFYRLKIYALQNNAIL
jgi:hypothetical protein